MASRTDQWSNRNKKFTEYVMACDELLSNVRKIEGLVKEMGNDPLNILDLLRPVETTEEMADRHTAAIDELLKEPVQVEVAPDPETLEELNERWLRNKKEAIAAPEWWDQPPMTETVSTVESLDEPSDPPVAQTGSKPVTWQSIKAQERVDTKNQKNVTWIYDQLMEGPVPSFELKKKALAAGISEYALLQARKSVNDIEISTVGFQGVRYWHLADDYVKLPKPSSLSKKFDTTSEITQNEQKLLDLLQEDGATTAELIGRTHWTPEKVKVNLQKLNLRKLIKNERATMVWTRV